MNNNPNHGHDLVSQDQKIDHLKPVWLRCEYRVNPLGIDNPLARLSWILTSPRRGCRQIAYQVLVATSLESLTEGRADLWDSGRVESDASVHVTYAGASLVSRQHCHWQVRVWLEDGTVSDWSEPAWWTMGLLDPADWEAQWIGAPQPDSAPWFRHAFALDTKPQCAVVHVAVLGYFELYVNDQKIGDEVLAPALSNYAKRTYYRTYEVSGHLHPGHNHIGLRTGQGWYTAGYPGVVHFSPVIRLQLELSNSSGARRIGTDTSWQTHPSERQRVGTWRNNDFGGERVDARRWHPRWWSTTEATIGWRPAVVVTVPAVPCTAQPCGGNIALPAIRPVSLERLPDGTFLIDFGTNLTGMMRATFRGLRRGQFVSMRYADLDARNLAPDAPAPNRWCMHGDLVVYGQRDEFIAAGEESDTFANVFNYHAFRYVLIEGLDTPPVLADLEAIPVQTRMDDVGSFRCSSDLYNRIHEMVRWTYRCLNLGGMTVDCPHRERLGYGDGQTIMDTGSFNFDTATIYAKWARNWWDEARPDGALPFVAPCPHGTGGGPAWSAMCIAVPWKTYLFHGDQRVLADGYPTMKAFMAFLQSHCTNHLLQDLYPGKKWENLGDWVPPGRGMDAGQDNWVDDRSRQFFNNCYRVHLLRIMQQIAGRLGAAEDEAQFAAQTRLAQQAIHQEYYDPVNQSYVNGEQPYLLFPVLVGVTPPAQRPAVLRRYEQTLREQDRGHLNSGMIGTQIVVDCLLELGRNDLVDLFVNRTTHPGWGYMLEQGATTCWEQWNGYYSHIHSCFPYIGGWFYRGLAGIQWDEAQPGFKHVLLRPAIVASVDWVECRYQSVHGPIVSNWRRSGDRVNLTVGLPANTTATLRLPATDPHAVTEGGLPLGSASGVRLLTSEPDRTELRLEAGSYQFDCPMARPGDAVRSTIQGQGTNM